MRPRSFGGLGGSDGRRRPGGPRTSCRGPGPREGRGTWIEPNLTQCPANRKTNRPDRDGKGTTREARGHPNPKPNPNPWHPAGGKRKSSNEKAQPMDWQGPSSVFYSSREFLASVAGSVGLPPKSWSSLNESRTTGREPGGDSCENDPDQIRLPRSFVRSRPTSTRESTSARPAARSDTHRPPTIDGRHSRKIQYQTNNSAYPNSKPRTAGSRPSSPNSHSTAACSRRP